MHNRECGEVDVSIVATYMMLKLFDLGLGSTYVGSFDYKELIKQFNIPRKLCTSDDLTYWLSKRGLCTWTNA